MPQAKTPARKGPAKNNKPEETREQRSERVAAEKREKDERKLEKAYEEMEPEAQTPDVEATSKVTKAQKEQAKLSDANVKRWLDYQYTESHTAAPTDNGKGQIDVHTVGGVTYINSHGERTLDHDDLVTLRKQLDAAFQAAS